MRFGMAYSFILFLSLPCHALSNNTLWYKEAAQTWDEALPLGNGRIGAMVFGGITEERLTLNEESLWAGTAFEVFPPNFRQHLSKVQALVLENKIAEAREVGLRHLTKAPTSFRSYQPLGDLNITMAHMGEVDNYRRALDMHAGLSRVTYQVDGITFTREAFVSAVDDVLVMRINASQAAIKARFSLSREKDAQIVARGHKLLMDGQIVDSDEAGAHDDNPGGSGPGGNHMRFTARLMLIHEGGQISTDAKSLAVENAKSITLILSAATNYELQKLHFDSTRDPAATTESILAAAARKSYEALREAHLTEHRAMFARASLDLDGEELNHLPTDQRLKRLQSGQNDPQLISQYFQLGRYLLMSSSRRPGRLPANLQGIWNPFMWAPWESDYHMNVNLQMNYWPADSTNLSDTIDPFVDWFELLAERGKIPAQTLYEAQGWVAHHASNVFGRTTASGSTRNSQLINGVLDPLAGAWMAVTLWRHYQFERDQVFLENRVYPVLKGASRFILDILVEDKEGYLVIIPSTSPENAYIHPQSDENVRISRASTYHTSIVREVLRITARAARELKRDRALQDEISLALAKLPPLRIGHDGTIQEWIEDFREADPGHRHISHLIGLHPFSQIEDSQTALFTAAQKTLARRLEHGGGHTGWSRAWIINFFARLRDGERAYQNLRALLNKSTSPNLLTHSPFQVDANFGGTAGIAEMLVQSHVESQAHVYQIDLLPALPASWSKGRIDGIKARGGFTLAIEWDKQRLQSVTLDSRFGGPVILRYGKKHIRLQTKAGSQYRFDAALKTAS